MLGIFAFLSNDILWFFFLCDPRRADFLAILSVLPAHVFPCCFRSRENTLQMGHSPSTTKATFMQTQKTQSQMGTQTDTKAQTTWQEKKRGNHGSTWQHRAGGFMTITLSPSPIWCYFLATRKVLSTLGSHSLLYLSPRTPSQTHTSLCSWSKQNAMPICFVEKWVSFCSNDNSHDHIQ